MDASAHDATARLIDFIRRSPTCFHAVANMEAALEEAGFCRLREERSWELKAPGRYYVARGGSSLIAFTVPDPGFTGFQIIASHSDSPAFRIKEEPEMVADQRYTRLNVEKYGGMLCAPWFDRPLSVAGRLMVRDGSGAAAKLCDIGRDIAMIPSLAIHMNREVNDGYKYNPQTDLIPLFGDETAKGSLMKLAAQSAGARQEDVLSADLFLYNRMEGRVWGSNNEFFSAPRLDDLQCAWASLEGLLRSRGGRSAAVCCVLDNEEIGSMTKQGAASTFLRDTLTRLSAALGRGGEQYRMALASSLMLSADNAHAVHPNHIDKSDPVHHPRMNGGIVVKFSPRYATDAVSAALLRAICERAGVPVQTFHNRSDMAGGSTLGNISNTQVALHTADIGLAQLAMHSPYETAGVMDTQYLIRAAQEFYSVAVQAAGDGVYRLV